MKVGELTAQRLDGTIYFLRLNQLPPTHALLAIKDSGTYNFKFEDNKWWFQIRTITHYHNYTGIKPVSDYDLNLLFDHNVEIGVD